MKRILCLAFLSFLCVFVLIAAALAAEQTQPETAAGGNQARGQEIIRRFVEVNRYWLIGPPAAVRQFSYTLNRLRAKEELAEPDTMRAPRARRTGVTYYTLLHHLAAKPESATVRSITEEGGRIRLMLAFDPAVDGECGNGVEKGYYGYFGVGGDTGYLVLDAERFVPLEAGIGKLTETFAEFVQVDAGHSVPLAITIQDDKMRFDWRFRLYEPGLWLFDDSLYGDRRVAWVEQVKVNEQTPVLRRAVEASLARDKAEAAGARALRTFLKANQHWLLPSLEARRGLIYEYRQEEPYLERVLFYLERVLFDPEGNAMVVLEATNESPDKAARQSVWLADGHQITCNEGDRYVATEPRSVAAGAPAETRPPLDCGLQNLAVGLGWDCGLTQLAREPGAFSIERLAADTPGQYRLGAPPPGDERLFSGTMLAFTSWAYMHDVRFDRSEILCDAATQRPLVERDFAGKDELKGEF